MIADRMYAGDWLARLLQAKRESKRSRPERLPANVWGLGVTSLLTDVSSEMVISILPAYLVVSGGMAPLALGVVSGLHEGGPMLAAWMGGLIADRSGRRKLTAGGGYALSAACRVGWLTLSGQQVTSVAGLIVGDRIGKAIRTAPRDAMISLSVPAGQLATAFGAHRALDAAGAAIGPVLAFVLLWQLPQRYDVVFLTSLVAALLGLAALALLVDVSSQPAADTRAQALWPEAAAVFTDPSLRRVLMLASGFGLVTIGDALVYLLIIQRSAASSYWVPLLYTGTALAFLVLALPIGRLADRIGRRQVFILGHVPLLMTYLLALSGPMVWPWNAVTCVALLGGHYAASDGVLAGLASGLLPTGTRAVGLAWVQTAVSIARLIASIAFGWVWTRAGDRVAVFTFAGGLAMVLLASSLLADDERAAAS